MCLPVIKRICHWGPLTAIGIIKLITGMTIHCNRLWWPTSTFGGYVNNACFMALSGLTLYNFLSSLYHGPGYLPLCWKPEDEKECEFLQQCNVCKGYKAPRSHHCRKCGRCVLKMDHHCPWINNCVGWGNHAHFTCFLFFATVGCIQACVVLTCSLFRAINRTQNVLENRHVINLRLYELILCVFALGFAVGVVIAVGMLLYFQIRAIVKNITGIEDWIIEKANYRRKRSNEAFVFPYDLGVWNNIRQVINWTCVPVGDGIYWTVREGCDQFSFTREQIAQKNEKRQNTRLYRIVRTASGYYFPVTQGFAVVCGFPCTDEPRLKLQPEDKVNVTRWRKHWLYGEKVNENSSTSNDLNRQRGWFPRRCAVEVPRIKSNKKD